jgi:hypothetical protein
MAQTVPSGSAHGIWITRQDPLSWTARARARATATAWITATIRTGSGSCYSTLVERVTLERFERHEVERGNPIPPANFTHRKRNKPSQINIQTWLHSGYNLRSSFWRCHYNFGWLLMVFHDTGVFGDFVTTYRSLTPSIVSLQMSLEQQVAMKIIYSTRKPDPIIFKPSYCTQDDEQSGRKTMASLDSIKLWINRTNWNQTHWMRVPWNNEFKHDQGNNVLISTCNHVKIGRFENNKSEWQFYKRFNMNRFSFHRVYKYY